MAKPIAPIMIGIDVSKAELVIARSDSKSLERITNTPRAISRWLKTLPSGTQLAFEATGAYHRTLASLAHQVGFALYLLDGYRLNRYRDGIGNRAKTDPADARLILRYLSKELSELQTLGATSRGVLSHPEPAATSGLACAYPCCPGPEPERCARTQERVQAPEQQHQGHRKIDRAPPHRGHG